MDETSDVTRREQVAVCFRFADEELEVHEEFAGLYQTSDTRADTLAKISKDVMLRLQLDRAKLCGQCYDGAASMSGERGGDSMTKSQRTKSQKTKSQETISQKTKSQMDKSQEDKSQIS